MTNKGKRYRSRGGRPPRLFEALEAAWQALGTGELADRDRLFIQATLDYERMRRSQRAARSRAGDSQAI